jgi:hypothetical protein
MNIEKLDTLLQNKMQRHESEVHDHELNSIFENMGVRKKRPLAYIIFGISVLMLSASILVYNTSSVKKASLSVKESPVIIDQAGEMENQGIKKELVKPGSPRLDKQNNIKSLSLMGNGKDRSASPVNLRSSVSFGSRVDDMLTDPETDKNIKDDYSLVYMGLEKKPYIYRPKIQPVAFPEKDGFIFHPRSARKVFSRFLAITKPELSFWVSPMLSFERTSMDGVEDGKVHKDYISKANSFEKPIFTLNSGIKLQFRLLRGLYIGTGIGYFQSGYAYDYDYRINNIAIEDSATGRIKGYIPKPDSQSRHVVAKGSHVGKYMELPLSTRFNLMNFGKFTLGLEPSYSLQILLQSKGEFMHPVTLQLSSDKSYRARTGNIQLSIPVNYKINDKISLYFTPYYGKALQPVSIIENRYRNYAGIKLSINYKLYNSKK